MSILNHLSGSLVDPTINAPELSYCYHVTSDFKPGNTMSSKSHKPVKPCEGCKLNLDWERCAAFDHPAEQWLHHPCKGYNNEELIAKLLVHNDGQGAYARKAIRKEDAKINEQVQNHAETRTNYKKQHPKAKI